MSGDVQVRKRKDKKKRKDDGTDGFNLSPSEDVNIHVHKEGTTGGNVCAKIVFVLLFSALIVLVGLIIKENRGLNELENVEVESRFSHIFEGWVEKDSDEHGDGDDHSPESFHHGDHDDDDDEDDSPERSVDSDEEQQESQEYEQDEDEEENESKYQSEEKTEETEEELESEIDDDNTDEAEDESNEKQSADDDDENINGDNDDSEEPNLENESEERASDENEQSREDTRGSEENNEPDASTENEDLVEEVRQNEETLEQPETEEPQPKQSSGHVNVGEEPPSPDSDYERSDITNAEDYEIRDELDAAEEHLRKNTAYANKLFEALIQQYPSSPRSLYGKAQALDILADQKQRNDLLQQALHYYFEALKIKTIPDNLYKIISERYIDRARFMGQYRKAVATHTDLIERFPDNSTYMNDLAVTYLTINLVEEARAVLKRVLARWPNDGFALVHYGFILKVTDNLLEESVNYMIQGLRTKAEGVVDGRFYFHLGDALARLHKPEEAMKIYEEGVRENVFMSKYQRSLYNIPRLLAKPWWDPEDLPSYHKIFSALIDNYHNIRREGLAALNSHGYFQDEAENLKDTGTWKQFELFARGRRYKKNCDKSPVTCSIIQSFPDASGCKRGQTKFSVMHPKTHVWPHCGPTNCRLRIHLGLKVPENTFIRVAEEIRSWKEGNIIIFDDSFEHEVWHNGTDFRLVLIVDIWHPELTASEKDSLSYI